jgi:hypothetical protein
VHEQLFDATHSTAKMSLSTDPDISRLLERLGDEFCETMRVQGYNPAEFFLAFREMGMVGDLLDEGILTAALVAMHARGVVTTVHASAILAEEALAALATQLVSPHEGGTGTLEHIIACHPMGLPNPYAKRSWA